MMQACIASSRRSRPASGWARRAPESPSTHRYQHRILLQHCGLELHLLGIGRSDRPDAIGRPERYQLPPLQVHFAVDPFPLRLRFSPGLLNLLLPRDAILAAPNRRQPP
jgi:hypothetical protein